MSRENRGVTRAGRLAVKTAMLELHAAEYSALTNRYAVWHALEFSVLPIIPLYLAVAFDLWKEKMLPQEVIVWVGLAGLYVMGWLWCQSLLERYAMVRYLETELRPKIESEFGSVAGLWGYERSFAHNRTTPALWIELVPVVFGGIFYVVTAVVRYMNWNAVPRSKDSQDFEIILALVALAVLVVFIKQSRKAGQVRSDWTKSPADAAKID